MSSQTPLQFFQNMNFGGFGSGKKPRERAHLVQKFQRAWDSIIIDYQTESNWTKHVSNTDIIKSLETMVDILVKEHAIMDGGVEPGGCTELFLNDDMMAQLVKISENDVPLGFRGEVIRFLNNLVAVLDSKLMIQNAIHRPTLTLIRLCLADKEKKYEDEMLELEYDIAAKIHEYPELLYIFFIKTFVPRNVSMESFNAGQAFTSTASLVPSRSSTTSASKLDQMDGVFEFSLFEHLLRYVHLEGHRGDFARESCLFLIELATNDLGTYIASSEFASVAIAGLGGLYSQLPPTLPAGISWGDPIRGSLSTTVINRRNPLDVFMNDMDSFMRLVRFVQGILLKCPSHKITTAMLNDLKHTFLDNIVQSSITSASDFDGTTVTALYYIHQMLLAIKEDQLSTLFAVFLLSGDDDDDHNGSNDGKQESGAPDSAGKSPAAGHGSQELRLRPRDILISKLNSLSEEVVTATLNLFQTLLSHHSVHSLHLLIERLPAPKGGHNSYSWDPKSQAGYKRSVDAISTDIHDHLSMVARYFALVPPESSLPIPSLTPHDMTPNAGGGLPEETTLGAYLTEAETVMKSHSNRHQRARAAPPVITSRMSSLPSTSQIQSPTATSPATIRRALGDSDADVGGLLDANSPVREAMIELGKDVTLRKFLGKFSNFFSHSYEINLALTGVISHLAAAPVPLLYMYLYASDVLLGPSYSSLHTVLVRLRREVEERRATIRGFDESLARTREQLFKSGPSAIVTSSGTSSGDWLRGRKEAAARERLASSMGELDLDAEFLKNVVVLEEAVKELLAIIVMHGSREHDQIYYL
ncbi:hypothetical protein HK101_006026 [Irineochytrium annulatum]|nr:hypothetical protein HK101_006026 [Irineochytrium annulatum]